MDFIAISNYYTENIKGKCIVRKDFNDAMKKPNLQKI